MRLWVLAAALGIVPEPMSPPAPPAVAPFDAAPVLVWQRRLPGVPLASATHTELSRPVVVGDEVLLGAATESALLALHRGSGEVLRRYPAEAPVASEAVVHDGRIWFADTAGYTRCVPLEGGDPIWTHFGGAPVLSRPSLVGTTLYIATVDDTLYALEAGSGALLWRYQRPPDLGRVSDLTLFGAPSPAASGDTLVAGFSDGAVVAFNRHNGEIRWERRVGEGRYPDLIASPTVSGGVAYIGGYSQPLVALDLESKAVLWRLDVGSASEPTVDGERLYHGGTDGKVRAIQRVTGEVLWTWDSGGSGAMTSPQVVPAGLVVSSSDSTLWILDPETGAETWRYEPGYYLDGVSVAPTIWGRQLLAVTNAGNLLSFVVPTGPGDVSRALEAITPRR